MWKLETNGSPTCKTGINEMTLEEVLLWFVLECKVNNAIEKLYFKDNFLLKNDVSERAIAHKFATYLQEEFPHLNVDCEYIKILINLITIQKGYICKQINIENY